MCRYARGCARGCGLLTSGLLSASLTSTSVLTSASGHLTSGVTSNSLFTGASLFTSHTSNSLTSSLLTTGSNGIPTGTSGLLGQLHNRSLLHTTTTILLSTISVQCKRQNYNQQHLHLSFLCVYVCVWFSHSVCTLTMSMYSVSVYTRWHGNLIDDF